MVNTDDPQGKNPKDRPFVIVRVEGEDIYGVAITSRPVPEDKRVELPWHPQGRVKTQLRKQSAAACHWSKTFKEEEIVRYLGIVPPEKFKAIIEKVPPEPAD